MQTVTAFTLLHFRHFLPLQLSASSPTSCLLPTCMCSASTLSGSVAPLEFERGVPANRMSLPEVLEQAALKNKDLQFFKIHTTRGMLEIEKSIRCRKAVFQPFTTAYTPLLSITSMIGRADIEGSKSKDALQHPIGTPTQEVSPSRHRVVFTTDIGPGTPFVGAHHVKTVVSAAVYDFLFKELSLAVSLLKRLPHALSCCLSSR